MRMIEQATQKVSLLWKENAAKVCSTAVGAAVFATGVAATTLVLVAEHFLASGAMRPTLVGGIFLSTAAASWFGAVATNRLENGEPLLPFAPEKIMKIGPKGPQSRL